MTAPRPTASIHRGARWRAVPPARGAFVGRAGEMETLGRLIDQGARLVTLTGTAGMGKTRLALEWMKAAGGALDRAGVAVIFCDLSEARGVDDACSTLARALGTPLAADASARDAVTQIGRSLAAIGRIVLVLDNLEQLVEHAPAMLDPWLSVAPGAQILVTSRARICIQDERCLEIEPLGLPRADERSAGEIGSSEAVELFVARARPVRHDFELSDAEAPSVAAIVRHLEGIPLAIELCAARMGVLGSRQILERLARRFDLLATGARGAPVRQATLRGAIAWSWDLLDPFEKAALAQCSVFHGGFRIEAAEAVLDLRAGLDHGDPPSALDVLQSLHDKSLVRAHTPSASSGDRRFTLLESVREFAEEQLAEHGGTLAVARHAAFFVGQPGSSLPRGTDVLRVIEEVDNLTAACARALAQRPLTAIDADVALRGLLILAPARIRCAEGRLEPYAAMLDAALEATKIPADPVIHARALYTRAVVDLLRGRIVECFFGFQRALDGARAAGSRYDEALALSKLALMLEHADQGALAHESFERARVIVRELDDALLEGDFLLTRGGSLTWQGRARDAAWHHQQAMTRLRGAGDPQAEALASGLLALARLNEGRLAEATAAAREALSITQIAGDRRIEGYVLGVIARVDQIEGRFDAARSGFETALAIHRAVGDRWSEGIHLGYLAAVAFEERRYDDARIAYGEAIAVLRDGGERHYTAIYLAALGAIEITLDHPDAGDAHLAAATVALVGVRVPATHLNADIFRGCADAVRAARAAAAGDIESAARYRSAATARIALAEAPAPDGSTPLVGCSEELRFALRILRRELDSPALTTPRAAAEEPVGGPVLIAGPEARWFRVRDREPVSMLKARSARLMLASLVRVRLDEPGRAMSMDDLFAIGWPGDRIPRDVAANRVYVTLSKLKKLGLRGLILSRDDGFLIDPAALVIDAADSAKIG